MSLVRGCFLKNNLILYLLDSDLVSVLVQVERGGRIRLVVYQHQHMLFGKTVDIQSHEGVGHDTIHQQAVVDINAEALAGKIGGDFNVVGAVVCFLLLGIPLEGESQVEEKDGNGYDRNEEYGIESHEIPVDIASFSAHDTISLCKTIKKRGKYCGSVG